MSISGLFNRTYRKSLVSAAALLALTSGGLMGVAGFKAVSRDGADATHSEIQLAQARELLGSDTIHLASAGLRKAGHLNRFVAEYVAASFKGESRPKAAAAARAVLAESHRHGFDPLLLLAVIQNESRFDPSVVGSHGEIGLMQIKPDTAEWIARKARIRWNGADALYDPAYNIRLGAAYLAMLRTEFGFSKDLYLAAYNMGSKNVRKLLSGNSRPMVYAEKTVRHYTQIYLALIAASEKERENEARTFAAI